VDLLPHAGIEECFFVKFDQAGALLELGKRRAPVVAHGALRSLSGLFANIAG
jgi:hypothetical protein